MDISNLLIEMQTAIDEDDWSKARILLDEIKDYIHQVEDALEDYHPEVGTAWRKDGVIGKVLEQTKRETIDKCISVVEKEDFANWEGDRIINMDCCIHALEMLKEDNLDKQG